MTDVSSEQRPLKCEMYALARRPGGLSLPGCGGTVFRRPTFGSLLASREGQEKHGAGDRTRTYDPRITNALLYQLSYSGAGGRAGMLSSRSRSGKSLPGRQTRMGGFGRDGFEST